MRPTKMVLACLAICAVVAIPVLAQEGHPLKGSWLGDWGPSKTERNQIFIVMDWDGKAVTGMLNPGTDNIPLRNAQLIAPPPRPAAPAGGGGGGRGGGAGAAPAAGGGAAAGAQGGGGRGGGGAGAAPAGGGAGAAGGQGAGGRGGGGAGLGTQIGGPGTAAPPPPPQDWLVHFEADAKDKAGNAVRYIVDGKIENLGLYNRSIVGTWTAGTVKGDFRLQRQ
jgi:hypothetical protein